MDQNLKSKLNELLTKIALLTAACEGNMYHERTITNEAIYYTAVDIQCALVSILEPAE